MESDWLTVDLISSNWLYCLPVQKRTVGLCCVQNLSQLFASILVGDNTKPISWLVANKTYKYFLPR